MTFNGEIYNFREIRDELSSQGVSFRSTSDTEVLLKAYACWGIDAVARFRGIFAFGLWDPRSRVVHLVRDPMGIKPLYWTVVADEERGEDVVLFASEVRALLASGAVPRRLSPSAVASYLWHGFVIGPGTIVEGVNLLPAASILSLQVSGGSRPGRVDIRPYWSPPTSPASSTVAELREELLATVQMQLVADVPLGIFLSGGVDSSAVAALATEAVPDAVHTFTVGFDVAAYDESVFAQRVADAIGSRHSRVLLTAQAFQEQLPDAFTAVDQPTFDAINTYFVSRAARRGGHDGGPGRDGWRRALRRLPELRRDPEGRSRDALDAHGGPPPPRPERGRLGAAHVAGGVAWNLLRVAPPQTRWGKAFDLACVTPTSSVSTR